MDIQVYLLCAAVLASIILSGVLTPYILLVSLTKRKVDKLDERKYLLPAGSSPLSG